MWAWLMGPYIDAYLRGQLPAPSAAETTGAAGSEDAKAAKAH